MPNQKTYHCPRCQQLMDHVETRTMHDGTFDTGGLEWYNVHFECMTCAPILSVTISLPEKQFLPKPYVTEQDMFNLGVAQGSFSVNQIDQGIHAVLPVRDVDTGEWSNILFAELVDEYFYVIDYPPGYTEEYPKQYDPDTLGMRYIEAIQEWCKDNDILQEDKRHET